MSSLEELLENQASTQNLIERILTNFNKLSKTRKTVTAVRTRIESLKGYWEVCQQQHARICALANEEARGKLEYFTTDKFEYINDTVEDILDTLSECLERLQPSHAVNQSTLDESNLSHETRATAIHLPRINIPKFAGEITKWENFRDIFDSLVSSRTDLSNVQKLHYLKANLTGEASLLLTNIQVTDANYNTAWALLKRRYDNPRAIVNAHLQAFVDIPSVSPHSLDGLKTLRDMSHDIYTALLNLKRPIDQWQDLMIFIMVSKLDKSTRRDWELSLGDEVEIPNFARLDGFLTTRIRALEAVNSNSNVENKRSHKSGNVKSHQVSSNNDSCVECEGNHPLHQCKAFLKQSVSQRIESLKRNKCCFNCMRKGHLPWGCKSKHVCTLCKQKHHTLIHREQNSANTDAVQNAGATDKPSCNSLSVHADNAELSNEGVSSHNSTHQAINTTILPTALVLIKSKTGRSVRVRALLDQGSQTSFVSESVVQIIKAERNAACIDVSGICGTHAGTVKTVATFTVEPCTPNGTVLPITALVMPKLTAYIPNPVPIDRNTEYLKTLTLADSEPSSKKRIELIIGADYYGSILRDGLIRGPPGYPTAQLTIFGWVISGRVGNSPSNPTKYRINVNHATTLNSLNDSIRKFWELEDIPRQAVLTDEEAQCEAHFARTHTRRSDGRYVVRLPFKTSTPIPIGDTATIAKRIFLSNEARLARQPDLLQAYRDFMHEYKELKHMEIVDPTEHDNPHAVYLPHHAAIKESSQTTKVRVVFNASRASSNGTTLNDFLHVGPKLQSDLFALVLRWRTHKFVYTADIEKMFRQIGIHPEDADHQRIFWRADPLAILLICRLLTLTYGMACSPFIACKIMEQLAKDEGAKFPLAALILVEDTYVDDLMFGAEDIVLLKQARDQLIQLLKAGGFRPRQWASNDTRLLADIPESDHGLAVDRCLDKDTNLKILGVTWNPSADAFKMTTQVVPQADFTKRSFLSMLARVYDPLGWVSPVTITAKVLMQSLWLQKVEWDDPLKDELLRRCLHYQDQLSTLNEVRIPRWTGQGSATRKIEIHGYADASNLAYAAVVYLRVESIINQVQVSLLYAKTKVAPLKVKSVPRLELCAAVLLVHAIEFVCRAMKLTQIPIYCSTDSTVVLAWLRSVATRWDTFVANRVSEIQTALPNAVWKHVATQYNPADCASRGVTTKELISHPLWWQGPPWLKEPASEWSVGESNEEWSTTLELRKAVHGHVTQAQPEWNLPSEISSWQKLLRITAYVRRFTFHARRSLRMSTTFLSATEVRLAKQFWIKEAQRIHFATEIRELNHSRIVKSNSPILALNPFLDDQGVLRVAGRLRQSELNYDEKFPIILPKCRVSELIIQYMHLRALHGGLQVTLRMLRQQYWILGARNLVKGCIRNCVICARQRATLSCQRMGDLPEVRVKPARPFTFTGVDYAGPFSIRTSKGRGQKTHKSYCALFICLSTRAIHLEVADDYSTDCFLATFDRFTARRGLPAIVYSDNGTNFQGADRELTRRIRAILRDPELQNHVATDEIEWKFIPPAAPQFGGLWEAGVKSVKHHLRRIIGDFTPTFEEFTTLLCKIECILNSRPIAPLFDDLDNFDALTPGHFLVGSHLKAVPTPSVEDINVNRLSRWQTIQRLHERFWKVWSSDYLNSLQQRGKWKTPQANLKVGDLVLLRHPNLPPTKWDLGRIVQCHPGDDDLVRVVTVRTATSVLKRPITQICKLPVESSAN